MIGIDSGIQRDKKDLERLQVRIIEGLMGLFWCMMSRM